MILVTGATGMFGGMVVRALRERGADVRAMVRSPERASAVAAEGVETVVGDMDRPQTLRDALDGAGRVFLVSPMDGRVADREIAVVDAAKAAGVERVVKLYGAVRHRGDPLDQLHVRSIEHLRASGLDWALVSPNTVMETNLLPQADAIKHTGAMWGSAGDGRIGMVAAGDCAAAAAAVLTDGGESAVNYEITGPEAITYAEIARRIARITGRDVTYNDLTEDEHRQVMIEEAGMPAQDVELQILCHFRAMRRGDADLVTDTYTRLTGTQATSIDEWLQANAGAFS